MRPFQPQRRRPRVAAALAAAAVAGASFCLAPSGAFAVSPPATVAETAARADLAVHGRVKSIESRWNAARTAIYSDVTLEVIRLLGTGGAAANRNVRAAVGSGGEVTLRLPGGEVDGVGMVVSHVGRPVQGQEVVALLSAPAGTPAGPTEEAATRLDSDDQTLTVAPGDNAWMPVQYGAVDLGGGRKAPVAELLSTVATSLKK